MTSRERLPNRRPHTLLSFEHDGHHYVGGIGRFHNGALAEVFVDARKAGSMLDAVARDAAIVCSIALQTGVPPETIRRAVGRNQDGSAATALGQLLDLVAA